MRVVVLASLLCSCSIGLGQDVASSPVQDSNDVREDPHTYPNEPLEMDSGWHGRIELFWVPVLGMKADIDEDEPGGGVEFGAEIESASGWGARCEFSRGSSKTAWGLMYTGTSHTEESTGSDVDIDAAYLIGSSYLEVGPRVVGRLTLGVGGVIVDFSEGFGDTGGGAAMIGGGLGVEVVENLYVGIDGGGFLWGYPGETIAYGGFMTLGAAYRF
jgi:hypothetical protein